MELRVFRFSGFRVFGFRVERVVLWWHALLEAAAEWVSPFRRFSFQIFGVSGFREP